MKVNEAGDALGSEDEPQPGPSGVQQAAHPHKRARVQPVEEEDEEKSEEEQENLSR